MALALEVRLIRNTLCGVREELELERFRLRYEPPPTGTSGDTTQEELVAATPYGMPRRATPEDRAKVHRAILMERVKRTAEVADKLPPGMRRRKP